MRKVIQRLACTLLLACGSAHANFIVTTDAGYGVYGTIGILSCHISCGSTAVSFNPATNLVTMGPLAPNVYFASGLPPFHFDSMRMIMNLSATGESSGGTFSIFGDLPTYGVNDSLLIEGLIVGANLCGTIDANGRGCDPYGGISAFTFFMQTSYVDPNIASWVDPNRPLDTWGTSPYFAYSCVTCATPYLIDPETGLPYPMDPETGLPPYMRGSDFFTHAWSIDAADYWDLRPLASSPIRSVPEPGTLALLGVGLAGIGFARRRQPAL